MLHCVCVHPLLGAEDLFCVSVVRALEVGPSLLFSVTKAWATAFVASFSFLVYRPSFGADVVWPTFLNVGYSI